MAKDNNTTREIGGYFELERFYGHELHEGALALDCARNCLAYVVEARNIRSIWVPYFLCNSVDLVLKRYPQVEVHKYEIAANFEPAWESFNIGEGDYPLFTTVKKGTIIADQYDEIDGYYVLKTGHDYLFIKKADVEIVAQ